MCLLAFVLFILVFTGCKKSSDVIEASHMKLEDKLSKLGVPEVMKNSSNENAQQAVSYFDQVTSVSDNFGFFDVPDDATRDGNNYYWSYGGFSLWEVYSDKGSSYTWDVYIKTTETSKEKYYHSEESKDGNSGRLEMYNYAVSTDDLVYTWDWSFDSKGNMTMTEAWADGSFKYVIVSNVDLSGSAKMYTNGKLFYEFVWNSDGSGSYKYYDDNGAVILSDSWTVADL